MSNIRVTLGILFVFCFCTILSGNLMAEWVDADGDGVESANISNNSGNYSPVTVMWELGDASIYYEL